MPAARAEAARPAETAPAPDRSGPARRTNPPGQPQCTLAVAEESLSLAVGGSAMVVARLEGGDLTRLTATTPNWSDIIILREPTSQTEPDTVRFTISSISKTAGTFIITLKSPCGAKEIRVTAKSRDG